MRGCRSANRTKEKANQQLSATEAPLLYEKLLEKISRETRRLLKFVNAGETANNKLSKRQSSEVYEGINQTCLKFLRITNLGDFKEIWHRKLIFLGKRVWRGTLYSISSASLNRLIIHSVRSWAVRTEFSTTKVESYP